MTTKDDLRFMAKPIGEGLKLTLPTDVAFVLLLGVKGTGEHICVSNLPADVTREWLSSSSSAEAAEGKL